MPFPIKTKARKFHALLILLFNFFFIEIQINASGINIFSANNRSDYPKIGKVINPARQEFLVKKKLSLNTFNFWDFESESTDEYTDTEIRQDFDPHLLYSHNSSEIVVDEINGVSTNVMKIKHEANKTSVGFEMYAKLDEDYNEIYLTYNWKFSEEFCSTNGGKLPGLAGSPINFSGCPETEQGFICMNMFKQGGRMITYRYDRTRTVCPSATDIYNFNPVYFANGVWYNITQRLVMNTFTNGIPNADGINEIWVDGKMIFQEKNLKLMEDDSPDMKIDLFALANFYGGSTVLEMPTHECYAYIDNIRIYLPENDETIGTHNVHDPDALLEIPNEITDKTFYYDKLINEPCIVSNSEYGSTYSFCKDEAYLIDAGAGNSVTFTLDEYYLGTSDCIFVYDGNTSDSELLLFLKGSNGENKTFESSGRYLFIRFSTDTEVNSYGWTGRVEFSNNPLPEIPSTPTGFQVTKAAFNSVALKWTDNSENETSFQIERRGPNDFTKQVKFSIPANTTKYVDNNIIGGSSYKYRIRAINGVSLSSFTNYIEIKTPVEIVKPAAPSSLQCTVLKDKEIALQWNDNSSNETSFEIERSGPNDLSVKIIITQNANITSYIDTDIESGSVYEYRIRAKNSAGYSEFSNILSITSKQSLNPPAAPTNLISNDISDQHIIISWNDNSLNETSFELERCGPNDYSIKKLITIIANTTTYTDYDIRINATYQYRIRACNEDGSSTWTNNLEINTPIINPPNPPTRLKTKEFTQNSITIKWDDNSENENYFVLKRIMALNPQDTTSIMIEANDTSFTDVELSPNTTYVYYLEAINKAGTSPSSNKNIASTLSKAESNRIKENLIAYYNFNFSPDYIIRDLSGYSEPLNLKILNPDAVSWNEWKKLTINSSTMLVSQSPANKIIDAIGCSGEITMECWIKPSEPYQTENSRIVSLGNNDEKIGFIMDQKFIKFEDNPQFTYCTRLHTMSTNESGFPEFSANDGSKYINLQHLVYVRDSLGKEIFYVNGKKQAENFRPNGLKCWSKTYYLRFANEGDLSMPWKGEFYLMAIYNKALSADEVYKNYSLEPSDNLRNDDIKLQFKTFPNPSHAYVNYEVVPEDILAFVPQTIVRLTDIYGKVYYENVLFNPNILISERIDVSKFPRGLYFLQLISGNKKICSKLILQ